MTGASGLASLLERPGVVVGLGFAGLLLALAPWPGIGHAYAVVGSELANAIAAVLPLASSTSLHFDAGTAGALGGRANAEWHTVVTVASSATGAATRSALNLRAIGYVPTVTFVAVSLAWPFHLGPHRWRLRGIGFALVQAFVSLSVALPLMLVLSSDRVRALELGPGTQALLRTAFEGAVVPPGRSFAVPACIWLLVVAASRSSAPTPMPR